MLRLSRQRGQHRQIAERLSAVLSRLSGSRPRQIPVPTHHFTKLGTLWVQGGSRSYGSDLPGGREQTETIVCGFIKATDRPSKDGRPPFFLTELGSLYSLVCKHNVSLFFIRNSRYWHNSRVLCRLIFPQVMVPELLVPPTRPQEESLIVTENKTSSSCCLQIT